jgi:hypothetical protein
MIIGICGFSGAGKDTIGDYLIKEKGFIHLSFAAVLKENVARLFCWDLEMCKGLTKESREWREQVDHQWSSILGQEITPRLALELGGTEGARNIYGENIFVGHVKMSIDKLISEGKENIVITDCRFPNEVSMIKSYDNSLLINVNRENCVPDWYEDFMSGNLDMTNIHPSKYMWIKNNFDVVINNNSSLQDLYNNIDLSIN